MGKLCWPLDSNVIRNGSVSNTYGTFPARATGYHDGWDLYAASGTPCYAIANGVIDMVYGYVTKPEQCKRDKEKRVNAYGKVVVLKFSCTKAMCEAFSLYNFILPTGVSVELYAAYCHLSAATVSQGDVVFAGQLIGYTGTSGNACGMTGADQHLHFEIRNIPRPPWHPNGPVDSRNRMDPSNLYGLVPLTDPVKAQHRMNSSDFFTQSLDQSDAFASFP